MLRAFRCRSPFFRVAHDRSAQTAILHAGPQIRILDPSSRHRIRHSYATGFLPQNAPLQTRSSFARRFFLSDRHPIIRWAGRAFFALTFSVVSITGGLLLWDATTYRTKHLDKVPINPLALAPKRGGPKNLKLAEVFIGDEETDDIKLLEQKPKLVILGGGWGVSFASGIYSYAPPLDLCLICRLWVRLSIFLLERTT